MERKRPVDAHERAVLECVTFLKGQGYEPIYVALFGSQNYGMATPTSDHDFKAIVAPSLHDLALNSSPISKTVEYGDGQVDIKDVRVAIDCFKKMNPSYMEILFTRWYWINVKYPEFQWFRNNRDEIAHCDEVRAINALMGSFRRAANLLLIDTPAQHDLIEKYGYSGKQLAHLIRYEMMLRQYLDKPYLDLIQLKEEDAKWLTAVKRHKIQLLPDAAEQIGRTFVKTSEEIFQRLKKRESLVLNKEMFRLMDEKKVQLIEKALRFELEI